MRKEKPLICKKCQGKVKSLGVLANRKRNYPIIYECLSGCKDKYGYPYRFTRGK